MNKCKYNTRYPSGETKNVALVNFVFTRKSEDSLVCIMGPQIVQYLVNNNCAVSLKYPPSER